MVTITLWLIPPVYYQMTCLGFDVERGDEAQIIAKTDRLQMRIVNASVLTDRNGMNSSAPCNKERKRQAHE